MVICLKKVGQDLEFKDVLSVDKEDIKNIIDAKVLGSMKINEDIVCLFDFNNLETNKDYNFLLLEEVKADYDLKGAIKGDVVFVRIDNNSIISLEEEDVDYIIINYMKSSCKDSITKKYYDTLEIFA